ncbi:cache domain-containing protein [Sulfurovum sp.]|uniref:cache domain-containing protein n=1 Tax=Sulfurovum sp. TaxID=1969726 RepID=UPI0028682308|nr:cache domain-containing protein [Sulfurovum sp.]
MQINIFKNKTIAGIHIITMMVMFIFVVLFTAIIFYSEYDTFDLNAEQIQKKYIKKQKESIVFDTQRVLEFIISMYEENHTIKSESELKREIINAIEHLYERQDGTGYIFIYDFDGTVLSDPVQKQNVGKNLYDIKDSNGVKVIEDLIDISRNKDGGFVEYTWLKPTTKTLSPKISYAKSFEPWQWMVGTGVYVDEIEKSIAIQRTGLKEKLNKYLIDIIFLWILLFTVGVMGIIISSNILKREIDIFTDFFQKSATSHSMIDVKEIGLLEFQNMVTYINTMVDLIHKRKQTLKELNATLEIKVADKTKDLYEKNKLLTKEKDFSTSLVKAQDSFIKHSIHEINTPLAVIMTHIDLFRLKEGENRYLSKIEAASKIIENIYNDLSYMVKKDRVEYEKSVINMSRFLYDRVDFFSEVSKGNKHKVVLNIEKDIHYFISHEKLQRVLDNNISNAIKFSKKRKDIEIDLYKEDKKIILTFLTYSSKIKDTESIFKAYKREDDAKGGFGLGLEIVYTICKQENIDIELTSNDDHTIFKYIFNEEL